MTGFCGAFARSPRSFESADHRSKLEIAKKVLSRAGDKLHAFDSRQTFIVFFDNGAFEPNRTFFRRGDSVACVSGDPLVVGETGIDNVPAQSAERVCAALIDDSDDTLRRATGSFVAVSWDEKACALRLCADKLALRPLYVYTDEALCLFATNLRTLLHLAGRPLEIDEQGLAEQIYLGQSFGSHTAYKNVRVLRPGEVLTIGTSGESSRRYFDWNSIPEHAGEESAICGNLYDAFIRAIRRRSRDRVEDAFLSGGLDSRCVVAGLLDIGRSVRTFGSSYEGSADDVIGRMVAALFGTEHTAYLRDPYEFILGGINHALYASDHFSRMNDTATTRGRVIWAGDGGSVGMGHVYLDDAKIRLLAASLSDDTLRQIFGGFKKRGTRIFDAKTDRHLRQLALTGLRSEIETIVPKHKERRLFLFYLLNDQMRHLYHHYEEIDLHAIEFATPFFDSDFLSIIVAAPVWMFLRHRLYNTWLTWFRTPAASLPWQVYPGHEPGPHEMPKNIKGQWSDEWYQGRTARRIADRVAAQILSTGDPRVQSYISSAVIGALRLLNRLGVERYNYELWLAKKVYDAITGTPIRG